MDARGQRLGRIVDAGDFSAVGGGGDQERRQAAVHPHPAARIVRATGGVLLGSVQVGGLDVERDPPPAPVMTDGGEEDFRPIFGDHAPQPAGVVMHSKGSDAGQRDRAGPVFADADRRGFALGVLVAQPKRRDVAGFLFEPREPDPVAFALA
jgi:hypothetical protein